MTRILILGGTGEARELAARLVALGHTVTTALAGRTSAPLPPAGRLRLGSFGGVAGLADYLAANRIDRLLDATHPYAARISANAVAAAAEAGVPLVRYMRPAWEEPPDSGWTIVPDIAAAAAALPLGATVLVTTGHQDLDTFLARGDLTLLVRLIEPPEIDLPPNAELFLARPPFDLAAEEALLYAYGVTHLVTKNSGGTATAAKLDAAYNLGVRVLMVARPPYPPATEVATLEAAIAALHLDDSG